jgi:hypothetical protein
MAESEKRKAYFKEKLIVPTLSAFFAILCLVLGIVFVILHDDVAKESYQKVLTLFFVK